MKSKINVFDDATNRLMHKFQYKRITYRALTKKFLYLSFAFFISVIMCLLFVILFIANVGA